MAPPSSMQTMARTFLRVLHDSRVHLPASSVLACDAVSPRCKHSHAQQSTEESVALVQGCDRGIGLEFVRQLLSRRPNGRVIATCPDPMGAVNLAAMKDQSSGRLEVLALDVLEEKTIQDAAGKVASMYSKLNLLINVSGVFHIPNALLPESSLKELNKDAMLFTHQVNAVGPLLVMKHMLPLLIAGGSSGPKEHPFSVVANLSSRSGSISDNHLGGFYSYRASKAALNQFTKTAAIEFAAHKTPVIAVSLFPGTVETDLTRPFIQQLSMDKVLTKDFAVSHLLDVIEGLKASDNGRFIAWDGSDVAW